MIFGIRSFEGKKLEMSWNFGYLIFEATKIAGRKMNKIGQEDGVNKYSFNLYIYSYYIG